MSPFILAASSFTMPDISPFLTKGGDAGNGVVLMLGDLYTWLLLGGGPLLVLGAFAMVRIMFMRVKFFALEYGNGGFFGRMMAIGPLLVLGVLLLLAGVASTWLGWLGQGYSLTLSADGLVQKTRVGTTHFTWDEVNFPRTSEHVKATDFTVAFTKGGQNCLARFQQRYIGERLQDKAISITEISMPRRN